ncbi:hypothetical protein SBC1_31360 [Caballeronia sp. SBC1]|uniref:hypothetical protein n=1 Tax=Caballeronia sp. SBC1 TaxID=2705548 RepID=UPI001409CE74|nr:hypothetical protein [Caballeronia sp. SBC1]QIN63112.1 hypothetical protein SBC1_31360 [Caballeronia sp. SBC1]
MALTPAQKDDQNSRSAVKDIQVKKEKDMRPPEQRQHNVFRDNPPEKSDPRSIFKSNG